VSVVSAESAVTTVSVVSAVPSMGLNSCIERICGVARS
jgi:hypothetical protein